MSPRQFICSLFFSVVNHWCDCIFSYYSVQQSQFIVVFFQSSSDSEAPLNWVFRAFFLILSQCNDDWPRLLLPKWCHCNMYVWQRPNTENCGYWRTKRIKVWLSLTLGTICPWDVKISCILICPMYGWNIKANAGHSSSCSKSVATSLCIFSYEQTNKRAFNKWRMLLRQTL